MDSFLKWVDPVEQWAGELADLVERWAGVNTWSLNPDGVRAQVVLLTEAFRSVGGELEVVPVPVWRPDDPFARPPEHPLGPALWLRKRPEAPVRVLLVVHCDTVFAPTHPFQRAVREGDVLRGPGVVDAKGGIAVMLAALRALEQSPWAGGVGWEVVVNPDEEIGSPGSCTLLREAAARCHLGLVFEPCLAHGSLIGDRKGSGNFTVVARGRAAHAGRNPEDGRNAVHALAELITAWEAHGEAEEGTIVNVAQVEGGGAVNIVPDLALFRANVRVLNAVAQTRFETEIARAAKRVAKDGIIVETYGGFGRPPRRLDSATLGLYEHMKRCGSELGLELDWGTSGGASDANLLAVFGLPAVDGLGPLGGGLHTEQEYVFLPSLVERARLTARFLMGLGAGEICVQS